MSHSSSERFGDDPYKSLINTDENMSINLIVNNGTLNQQEFTTPVQRLKDAIIFDIQDTLSAERIGTKIDSPTMFENVENSIALISSI